MRGHFHRRPPDAADRMPRLRLRGTNAHGGALRPAITDKTDCKRPHRLHACNSTVLNCRKCPLFWNSIAANVRHFAGHFVMLSFVFIHIVGSICIFNISSHRRKPCLSSANSCTDNDIGFRQNGAVASKCLCSYTHRGMLLHGHRCSPLPDSLPANRG
jgi:hypothetical protein